MSQRASRDDAASLSKGPHSDQGASADDALPREQDISRESQLDRDDPARLASEALEKVSRDAAEIRALEVSIEIEPATVFRA
jgi:hypothetical protein